MAIDRAILRQIAEHNKRSDKQITYDIKSADLLETLTAKMKELLSQLNRQLQEDYSVTVTPIAIVNAMKPDEVPDDINTLLTRLDQFRKASVPSS